jgi:hypothetical protein
MVIAVSASRDGCRCGNLCFPALAAAPLANAVIANESAFLARGLTFQDGMTRHRAVNTAFYFTGWRCRLITANTGLSTNFSPGDTLRGDNLMKRPLFPPETVLSRGKFPRDVIRCSRFP